MKYFIDFEAQQYSNYIISVGCVRENGDEFYSLVKPASKDHKKVSKFISELTGITTEMVKEAPEADEVFSNFFDWCAKDDSVPEFYCYGNCDTEFIKANFNKSNNLKAKSILGFMFAGMIDYSPTVKGHFGLVKLIGLAKVANYYRGESIIQDHNALNDAKLLKYIYEQIHIHPMEEDANAFPDYQSEVAINDNISYEVSRTDENGNTVTYKSLNKAAKALIQESSLKSSKDAKVINIAKRIKSAASNKTSYHNFFWSIEIR